MIRNKTFLFLGLAGALALTGTAANAQNVDFSGKRIDAIIGSSPGGGTDGTTRLVGRFLEKYLPGKPTIVYRNMPAGHGVQALNYFANVVKKDGTAWVGGSSSYVEPNNLRKSVVEYDPRTFEYIGGIARGGSVVTVRKSKIADIKDKSKPPVIIGETDGSRSWAQMILWGMDNLDWNFKFVIGYPGAPAMVLAMRRGEIDAMGTSAIDLHRTLIKTGDFQPFVQLGEAAEGKIVPRVSFPDVQTMPELMKGKLEGTAKEAFDYWVKTNQIDKWYALPPGTPKDVVLTYRAAYAKAVKDPEFIKFGQHQFSEDFGTQTAEDVYDLISSTAYPRAEIFTYLNDQKVRHGLPAEPLSEEEMAKLAEELGGVAKVSTTLEAVENGGRELHFKGKKGDAMKVGVSSSRTKVTISGKEDKRANLKAGMSCDIAYMGEADKAEATTVACK